jgi:hypothetical protein
LIPGSGKNVGRPPGAMIANEPGSVSLHGHLDVVHLRAEILELQA